MFIFGHVGIGRRLAGRWRARLPALPLVVGTLLPDLIDKPLYYARLWPFVNSTRTFGHTGLLLVLVLGFAYARRSAAGAALGVGIATHLLLDLGMEMFSTEGPRSTLVAITWPVMSVYFTAHYVPSMTRHLESLWTGRLVLAEAVGLLLIVSEMWRRRR